MREISKDLILLYEQEFAYLCIANYLSQFRLYLDLKRELNLARWELNQAFENNEDKIFSKGQDLKVWIDLTLEYLLPLFTQKQKQEYENLVAQYPAFQKK